MIVLAGTGKALEALLAEAPPTPARDPLRLVNHGPFHTPLMKGSSERALDLPADWFGGPDVPMIDGRGHIWRPHAATRTRCGATPSSPRSSNPTISPARCRWR